MQIRTDLAMESARDTARGGGIYTDSRDMAGIIRHYVRVETPEAAETVGKPQGQYITLCLNDLSRADVGERKHMAQCVAESLRELLPPFGDALVVGLGNRHITADSLGSKVVESMLVTRHMLPAVDDALRGRLRGVCAIAPGVLGVTGLETAEMVRGVVQHVSPSVVIAIDALAARESARICTTVQITDTGICPGSGVGNHRMGLTRETLGVPVIAIGVPVVVYAAVIARDALSLLVTDLHLDDEDHNAAIEALVNRVTGHALGDMVVTPREIDEMVSHLAQVLALGLNAALQPRLGEDEISFLMHE